MNCFFREQKEALYNCNKPYQYVGGEFLSYEKDFDAADVKFLMAFPDKYEIGISNLGVRVLYEQINKTQNFMCDRLYAPEPDFVPNFLYGVETKRPAKDFDAIGFSLQWELSYPTVLKMLEMSGVPYRNDMRNDEHPIIVAGGPCTYNPLPMSDFIDCFIIGDGEDSILELCEMLKKTKGLPRKERIKTISELDGVWAKGYNTTVNKRIAQLKTETAPTRYPIPFSNSVQDRAVVEIRRGCGRMCRFCQPGHVTLPIRERSGEEIVDLTKKLVKNTGYDEYSLLSLSSNDYSNINEVIKELAVDFNERKISVSLPSQRIDGFNLELANLVQSVRKSTMTLAPEAGSQRLRNVIKKNISEEQILNAALTLYENGWSRIKFYFIAGLPTETLEDMDEMAELLSKIKYRAKLLKREKDLKHGLDITCTLSIFVPKPFTPFQWCPQMDIDKVTEHIKYLKSKTDKIKGVKINYHEKFVSIIEAVVTRGDERLCAVIEALYKKGCYLDSWGEYFDKDVWFETALEQGISLEEEAKREFGLDEVLPWDFINIGVNKEWFVNEYKSAFEQPKELNLQPTCENKCIQCGVCPNLKTRKVLAKPFKASEEAQKIDLKPVLDPSICTKANNRVLHRYRIKVTKKGILKYFSHLDWQNTFFKAVSRTDLNVAFSMGFNPMMKISMGVALPLFIESDCEFVDIELLEDTPIEHIENELKRVLHKDAKVLEVKKLDKSITSIDTTVYWAEYKVDLKNHVYKNENIKYNIEKVCSSDEIFIKKTNKKGIEKTINIKNSLKSYRLEEESLFIVLRAGQNDEIVPVRIDDFMKLIDETINFEITRTRFFSRDMKVL
ncbi:TIGR03936 family radical SAM-associated protein [bacterium]|nr:TIGR03936 family radical SAM-associated protein [bacterium]